MNNLYNQNLLEDYKNFKDAREKLKNSLFKELIEVLHKSSYYRVEISDGNIFSYDENDDDIEDDEFDGIIGRIIFDYNTLDIYDTLNCELFRNKDF